MTALLIEDFLRESGCDVFGPVAHRDVAVDALAREHVDAALLDVRLGGADCYAIARKLDELDIPFGFVTGYGTRHNMGDYRTRPMISKPFSKAEIHGLLRKLLGRKIIKAR